MSNSVNKNLKNEKEVKTMANNEIKVNNVVENENGGIEINTHDEELNQVEFTIKYQENGGAITPVINGEEVRALTFGYVSESDKKACTKRIEEALKATGGDIGKTIEYLMNAILTTAKGITPDKQVEVEGMQLMIVYKDKKILTLQNEEIANCEDIETDVPEAIEAILVERAKTAIKEIKKSRDFDDYFDDYDDDDDIPVLGIYMD